MNDEIFYPELNNGTSWDEFLQSVNVKANVKTAYSELSPDIIADLFGVLEHEQQRVAAMMMNAVNYVAIRKFGRDIVDPECKQSTLQKGLMAYIWGAQIMVDKKVPVNTIIVLSEPMMINKPHFIPRLAETMKLADNTFEGAAEIIQYYDRMKELSKEIQSVLDKSAKLMYKFITVIEHK